MPHCRKGFNPMLYLAKNSGGQEKEHYSCKGRIEKFVPLDRSLSSLGKPRDAKRRFSGWIFLSYPHTHDIFLYYIWVGVQHNV